MATLASREAAAGGDSPGADALGAGWGITKGLDPEMALLAEHLLKPLPADRQIETGPFLEAVAHLPPFFGESRAPPALPTCPDLSAPSLPSDEPHHSLSSIAPYYPLLLHHGLAAPTSGSPERLHPRFHFFVPFRLVLNSPPPLKGVNPALPSPASPDPRSKTTATSKGLKMGLQNSRTLFRGSHEKVFLRLGKGSGEGKWVGCGGDINGRMLSSNPSLPLAWKGGSPVRHTSSSQVEALSPQTSFRPSSSPPPVQALLESGRKTDAICPALCLAVHKGCNLSHAFCFVGTLPVPYPASSFGDFAGQHQPPGQSPGETYTWAEP